MFIFVKLFAISVLDKNTEQIKFMAHDVRQQIWEERSLKVCFGVWSCQERHYGVLGREILLILVQSSEIWSLGNFFSRFWCNFVESFNQGLEKKVVGGLTLLWTRNNENCRIGAVSASEKYWTRYRRSPKNTLRHAKVSIVQSLQCHILIWNIA